MPHRQYQQVQQQQQQEQEGQEGQYTLVDPPAKRKPKNQLAEVVKSRAWELLIMLFVVGSVWGQLRVEMAWRDKRIEILEAEIKETKIQGEVTQRSTSENRWQITQTAAIVTGLQTESKGTQQAVSDLKAQIGILGTKLDVIGETLRRIDQRAAVKPAEVPPKG